MPDPIVRMGAEDANPCGLADGDKVRVFNWRGEIEMSVEVTNMVMPGVVDIFHGQAQPSGLYIVDCATPRRHPG